MKVDRYLDEYEMTGPHGPDFHRPLSTYLNQLAALGGAIVGMEEPALPEGALHDVEAGPGAAAYVDVPNFVVVAARR